MIRGVIFDLDGMLLETEEYWDRARGAFVEAHGGHWTEVDQRAVMGHNTRQWARYLRERFDLPLSDEQIAEDVIGRMMTLYQDHLPLLPGAVQAVRSLVGTYRLGVASSSPLRLIRFAVAEMGLADAFQVLTSSDEVERGKPAPDVYLLACRRLIVGPPDAVAFEDSTAGIASAKAAGLRVIAVPNRSHPPDPATLAQADRVLRSLEEFTPELLAAW